MEFSIRGGEGPSDYDLGSVSIIFYIISKHGLNHPEMQRNFFLFFLLNSSLSGFSGAQVKGTVMVLRFDDSLP